MTADVYSLCVLVVTLAGWMRREHQRTIEYLIEETRGRYQPPSFGARSASAAFFPTIGARLSDGTLRGQLTVRLRRQQRSVGDDAVR